MSHVTTNKMFVVYDQAEAGGLALQLVRLVLKTTETISHKHNMMKLEWIRSGLCGHNLMYLHFKVFDEE